MSKLAYKSGKIPFELYQIITAVNKWILNFGNYWFHIKFYLPSHN